MKSMMIATVAGFAGLATASPFFANGVQATNPGQYTTRGAAQTATLDLTGFTSFDSLGSAINETATMALGANATVIGIGWDNVTIQTVGASWLSEAVIYFVDSPIGLQLSVGSADSFSGTGTYSSGGILDLASIDPTFPFQVGADGILDIEFYDSFDDVAGAADAFFLGGTLTIQYVPTPGALAVLGLGGLVAGRRRR
jgi:uncharacterized protein (TIGR03382 family)